MCVLNPHVYLYKREDVKTGPVWLYELIIRILHWGKQMTHNFPDFVLSKAFLTTQEHEVLAVMFWRHQRSSRFFVFCVAISTCHVAIYTLMSYCIQWFSFFSKLSFELIALFISVCLLQESLGSVLRAS